MGFVPGFLTKHWLSIGAVVLTLATTMFLLWQPGDERSSLHVRYPFGNETLWQGELITGDPASGERVFVWSGVVRGYGRWFAANSIGFRFATNGRDIPVATGILTVGSCRFFAQTATLRDNHLHYFDAEAPCDLSAASQGAGHGEAVPFAIRLQVSDPDAVPAAWSHNGWNESGFLVGADKDQRVLLDELIHHYEAPFSRFRLLAGMWGGLEFQLAAVLLLALFLLSAAFAAAAYSYHNLFVALLFAAISLVTAVLVPPFQAPDEPDHFLSYLRLSGQGEKTGEAAEFAARGHFPMIRQVPAGKMHQYEVGYPSQAIWQMPWQDRVVDSRMEQRSALVAASWRTFAGLVHGFSPGTQLLWLRCLLAVLSIAPIWFLGRALGPHQGAAGLASVLLIPPALPLFAVHLSNYPFLFLSTLLAFASALLTGSGSLRRIVFAGLAAGIFSTGCALISRSGFLIMLVVAPVLTMEFGIRAWREKIRSADLGRVMAAFVVPYLMGSSLLFFAPDGTLVDITSALQKVATKIGLAPDSAFLTAKALFLELAVFWMLILLAVAWLLTQVQARAAIQSRFRTICSWSGGVLAGLFVLLCFKKHYQLPDIQHMAGTVPLEYVTKALKTFLRDLTPFGNDFFISSTFWTGFGWLELHMPEAFSRAVKAIPVVLLGAGIWYGRKRLATWWRLFWFGGGLLMLLAGLALGAYGVRYNLHGRYLLIFYLGWLILSALMFRPLWATLSPAKRVGLGRVAVAALLCSHVFTWGWVLGRYF